MPGSLLSQTPGERSGGGGGGGGGWQNEGNRTEKGESGAKETEEGLVEVGVRVSSVGGLGI